MCEMIMKMPFCEDSVYVEASDSSNMANPNPQTNPLVKVGVCGLDCWRVGGTQSESAPDIWELLPALWSSLWSSIVREKSATYIEEPDINNFYIK